MINENLFLTSMLHLLHRYKNVILLFILTAVLAVTIHHFQYSTFLATASLRVAPPAVGSTEIGYVRYLKFLKSRNFYDYVISRLSKSGDLLPQLKNIYSKESKKLLPSGYADLIFADVSYAGRESDIIDITAIRASVEEAVDLANLMASLAKDYMLENETAEVDDTSLYLGRELAKQQAKIDSINRDSEGIPETASTSPNLSSMDTSLSLLKQELNLTKVKVRENSYLALEIINQIKQTNKTAELQKEMIADDNLRGRLLDKLRDLRDEDKSYKSKIRALEEQVADLNSKIDPRLELKVTSFQKKLELEQEILLSLKKRIFDNELYKVSVGSHVRNYSKAVPALVSRKLSLDKKLLMTLILSLAAISLIVLMREKLLPTVCHSLHLQSLGIGFLASIPNLSESGLLSRLRTRAGLSKSLLISNFAIKDKKTLPFQFLRLKVMNLFAKSQDKSVVMSILSCSSGEGKSLIAGNLASCFDFYQKKTIIVDCDPVHSGQTKMFGTFGPLGFGDATVNPDIALSQIVQKTGVGNLDIIPAGQITRGSPGQFDKNISQLVKLLKEKYEIIILDAPNFFFDDNAVTLAQLSEIVIVVSDAYHTRMSDLSNVVNTLRLHEIGNIYGVINRAEDYFGLNNVNVDTGSINHNVMSLKRGA